MPDASSSFIARISGALGRERPPTAIPEPPAVDESIARLVARDADLLEEFTHVATTASKMRVRRVAAGELIEAVTGALREHGAQRIVVTRSGLPASLDLAPRLSAAGFEAAWWSETTPDETYEADAGVTDVWLAVAETGSLVLRASPEHGRAVSLVPPLHVAIVEASQIVPDLIDAMQRLAAEGAGSATIFITGPSKTSDIEMTLVTGVHGPMEVAVFVVE